MSVVLPLLSRNSYRPSGVPTDYTDDSTGVTKIALSPLDTKEETIHAIVLLGPVSQEWDARLPRENLESFQVRYQGN